ncbi:MAG: hypothetical protein JXR83_15260 [Deltaproteobacteria bacterium]|nr:hypothetical protein [Deltaproteobacteria bacterium]
MKIRAHPSIGSGAVATVFLLLHGAPALAQEQPSSQPSSQPGQPTAAEQQLEQRVHELEQKLEAMSAQMEADSLERMLQDAKSEAAAGQEEQKPEQREFLVGGLALQKLNPEISVSADMLAGVVIDGLRFYAGEEDRSGIPIRAFGLNFQHVLDPYSMFKSAVEVIPGEMISLEEVYVSWFGLIPSLSFSVGRFRQNFGILNRWHEHDLDQINYPLAMLLVLGEDGLLGNGVMVKWMLPALWAHANELTLEVVEGENETLFAGKHFSVPAAMLHLKNYYDLNSDTYLELGLTGMFGVNNRRGLLDEQQQALIDEPWRTTAVAGADLTVYWSPLQQAKYRSLTWRSEIYYANKQVDVQPARYQHSGGLYSYLQYQLSERWFVGLRGDAALPTERSGDRVAWDVVPYATFWQSEFVYLRLEYSHGQNIPYRTPAGNLGWRADNRVLLQVDFAAGPHKHEKY